jgi:hypothetical protein
VSDTSAPAATPAKKTTTTTTVTAASGAQKVVTTVEEVFSSAASAISTVEKDVAAAVKQVDGISAKASVFLANVEAHRGVLLLGSVLGGALAYLVDHFAKLL